jgi:hypothetical protein
MSINSVDVSQYMNKTGVDTSADTAEVTVLGNTAKDYIPGLEDGTIPLAGPYDAALDAAIDATRRTKVPFIYQPQGSTSGLPKYTGNCILTSYKIETGTDDAGTWEAEYQMCLGWTRSTNA